MGILGVVGCVGCKSSPSDNKRFEKTLRLLQRASYTKGYLEATYDWKDAFMNDGNFTKLVDKAQRLREEAYEDEKWLIEEYKELR